MTREEIERSLLETYKEVFSKHIEDYFSEGRRFKNITTDDLRKLYDKASKLFFVEQSLTENKPYPVSPHMKNIIKTMIDLRAELDVREVKSRIEKGENEFETERKQVSDLANKGTAQEKEEFHRKFFEDIESFLEEVNSFAQN